MGGPWERYQQQPANGMALPQPGAPTEFTGQGTAGQVVPKRLSDDTLESAMFDIYANGGKGMSGILNNDPGAQYMRTYANKQAEDHAEIANVRAAVEPLLRRVDDFEGIAKKAGPDVLAKATGPNYGGDSGVASWVLPDTSSQAYQNVREMAQHLNPLSDQESYRKATNANLEMQHLRHAVAASFKSLPGSGKGGATDQAQRTVDEMLGAAMNAKDSETFFKILHDAKNTLRTFARMQDLPERQEYKPETWQAPADVPAGDAYRMSFTPQAQADNAAGKPEPLTFKGLPKGWEIRKVR